MPLIVITGCDGVGKSTIARALSTQGAVYRQAHWSDFASRLGLERTAASLIKDMNPTTRALFILLLNWGLHEQVVAPMLRDGHAVICESYYFKFLAKERLFQLADLQLIENLSLLPPPDLIVDVSVHPEVAFKRIAARLNDYETFGGRANRDDFVYFQERIRCELDTIVGAVRVPVLSVDGSEEEPNYSYIHNWISCYLKEESRED